MTHLETFDAEDVLSQTRTQAVMVCAAPLAAMALTIALAVAGRQELLGWGWVGGGLAAAWIGAIGWTNYRLRALRRLVWRVQLTRHGFTGLDYARRPITLAWGDLRRVHLSDAGLRVVRSRHCVVRVPASFGCFDRLARRVVREAERAGAELWIDGAPLRSAPLGPLRSLLSAESPSDDPAPGQTA